MLSIIFRTSKLVHQCRKHVSQDANPPVVDFQPFEMSCTGCASRKPLGQYLAIKSSWGLLLIKLSWDNQARTKTTPLEAYDSHLASQPTQWPYFLTSYNHRCCGTRVVHAVQHKMYLQPLQQWRGKCIDADIQWCQIHSPKSPNPARYIILLDFWLLQVYGGKKFILNRCT
jgi:hypothetical protein